MCQLASRGFVAVLKLTLLGAVIATAMFATDIAPRMLLLDVAAVAHDLIAVGERGVILRSSDAARSWQSIAAPTTATLTALNFAPDAQHGWIVGHDALILSSSDGGRSWKEQWQGENLSDSFLDVRAFDARHVIAVGAYGLFLATDDGGKTWARRKIIEEDVHLNRLTRGPGGTLYLAGEHGTLLRSIDNGAKWSRIASPYDGSFYGILPLDRRTLIAHGLRGRLFRSTDDGATWEPIVTPHPVLLATALQLQSNTLLLAGQSRGFLVSRDYGHKFIAWDTPLTTAVAKIIELPDGSVLAVGEAGATLLPKP